MNEDYIKQENVLNAGVLKQNPATDVEKDHDIFSGFQSGLLYSHQEVL